MVKQAKVRFRGNSPNEQANPNRAGENPKVQRRGEIQENRAKTERGKTKRGKTLERENTREGSVVCGVGLGLPVLMVL